MSNIFKVFLAHSGQSSPSLPPLAQPAITCSKLTIDTIEQGVKYVQS